MRRIVDGAEECAANGHPYEDEREIATHRPLSFHETRELTKLRWMPSLSTASKGDVVATSHGGMAQQAPPHIMVEYHRIPQSCVRAVQTTWGSGGGSSAILCPLSSSPRSSLAVPWCSRPIDVYIISMVPLPGVLAPPLPRDDDLAASPRVVSARCSLDARWSERASY
jgi:hypothetical protein